MKFIDDNQLFKILILNIRNYREVSGISQEDLSMVIGKRADYMKRLENFELKKLPSAEIVYKISIVLRVSVENLLDPKILENNNNENRIL